MYVSVEVLWLSDPREFDDRCVQQRLGHPRGEGRLGATRLHREESNPNPRRKSSVAQYQLNPNFLAEGVKRGSVVLPRSQSLQEMEINERMNDDLYHLHHDLYLYQHLFLFHLYQHLYPHHDLCLIHQILFYVSIVSKIVILAILTN